MIYLIGGPPKCGKTTLAKKLSKYLGIQWVASDTLQVVAREYVSKYASKQEMDKLYPHNAQKGKTNDETYSETSAKLIKDLSVIEGMNVVKCSYNQLFSHMYDLTKCRIGFLV